MRKKFIYIFISLGCLIGLYYLYQPKRPTELFAEGFCAFCDRDILNRQKFYEDDLVFALYTHKPVLPGHCLIVPKRHVERFEMLTDEEITQVGRVIKKVNEAVSEVFHTTSYLILQKNGPEVGQSVPHVHFHYIPREKGDDSTLKFLARMYLANLQEPLPAAEMQERVGELARAMEQIFKNRSQD